jgi:hypothetical protein
MKSEQATGLILERKMMMKSILTSQRTDHKINAAFAVRIILKSKEECRVLECHRPSHSVGTGK